MRIMTDVRASQCAGLQFSADCGAGCAGAHAGFGAEHRVAREAAILRSSAECVLADHGTAVRSGPRVAVRRAASGFCMSTAWRCGTCCGSATAKAAWTPTFASNRNRPTISRRSFAIIRKLRRSSSTARESETMFRRHVLPSHGRIGPTIPLRAAAVDESGACGAHFRTKAGRLAGRGPCASRQGINHRGTEDTEKKKIMKQEEAE